MLSHLSHVSLWPHGLYPSRLLCPWDSPRILEWVSMPSSRGTSRPRDQIWVSYVSCIARQILSLPLTLPGKSLSSVQSLSCVQLFVTPWTATCHASLSITNSWSLLLWVGDAIQPSHLLLSPSPPDFNFPSIRIFSNESVLRIRWPKYWSFSFSISPSDEYSGLSSFRMDWLDLLAVQDSQDYSPTSKAIDQKHQFFSTQLSL